MGKKKPFNLSAAEELPRRRPSYETALSQIVNEAWGLGVDDMNIETKGVDVRRLGKTEAERAQMVSGLWREDPVPFDEFVVSPRHMNQPSLSVRQREDMEKFAGVDPKRLFFDPQTTFRIAVLMWGKGCLSGDTLLTDRKSGETRTLREWTDDGRALNLLTTDGKRVWETETSPAYYRGTELLLQVALKDGRTFTAAANHSCMTPSGWSAVSDLGAGSSICVSSSGGCLSCASRSADRGTRIVEDCQGDCRPSGRSCDELSHGGAIPDADGAPSPVGARGRNHPSWRGGGPEPAEVHILTCPEYDQTIGSLAYSPDGASERPSNGAIDAPFPPVWRSGPTSDAPSSRCDTGWPEMSGVLEYVQVASVSPAGFAPFYTVSVEGSGCYLDDDGIVHQNSGKDWLCSMIQCWVVHILLCMKDPRKAVGMPPGEPIDIVNVAYSAKQAKDVFFSKFTGRLKGWKWLFEQYLVMESGRTLNKDEHPATQSNDEMRVVKIKADQVVFPFKIIAHSLHSENEAAEGKSPLFWIMDEAAAFRTKEGKANGRKIYNTLKSSSTSRYPSLWRGMVISYTRSRNDFMMQLYKESEGDETIFRSKAATWEVNPLRSRADFDDEYRLDPKTARGMYECEPPASEFGFFAEDNVKGAFLDSLPSSVMTKPAIVKGWVTNPRTGLPLERMFVGKVVHDIVIQGLTDKAIPRVVHVDGGLTGNRAGMVVGHGLKHLVTHKDPESGTVHEYVIKKMRVDVALYWQPDAQRNMQISLNNIASCILKLVELGFKVQAVSYDQWNSASAIEALTMRGIYCESHNINTDDYTALRTAFNLGAVEIPCDHWTEHMLLHKELTELEGHARGQTVRVDHPPEEEGGSKDVADCLAGCWRLLNDPMARQHSQVTQMPRSTLGTRPGSQPSPYAATGAARQQGLTPASLAGSVVDASIRQGQPLARLHQMVAGEDQNLPFVNKHGQAMKFPRAKIMRGI